MDTIKIINDYDAVRVRQAVRRFALQLGFSMIAQTKIATVASELARNILNYAESGEIRINRISDAGRKGLKLIFQDKGPGIKDVAQALKDGYSSTTSLGMGLSISRKFSDAFDIESEEGKGTSVVITNWVKSKDVRKPPRFFSSKTVPGSFSK